MRPIKFRAWDKEQRNFYYFSLPDKGADTTQRELEHRDLQQFTGLLDKNGKEEYHGDILKISSQNSAGTVEPGVYEVVWFCSGFYVERESFGEKIRHPLAETPHGNTEVIGNIYENPEILETARTVTQ